MRETLLSRRRFVFLGLAGSLTAITPRLSGRATTSAPPDLFLSAARSRRFRPAEAALPGEPLVLNRDAIGAPSLRLRVRDCDTLLLRSSAEDNLVHRLALDTDEGFVGSLTEDGDLVFGTIYLPGGVAISIKSDQRASWYEPLDRRLPSGCDGTARRKSASAPIVTSTHHRRAAMPPSPQPVAMRLALYYTADALHQDPKVHGDPLLFEQWLRSRVSLFNSVAATSGVPWVSYEIAKFRALQYQESLYQDVNLRWLSSNEEIADFRREDQADVVALVTGHGGNLAYCPSALSDFTPDWGFATFAVAGAEASITDCHEIGHPIGLDHDAATAAYEGRPYSPPHYRAATIFPATTEETLMGRYFDSSGLYYHRIPRLSNPDLSYQGMPAGSASANNALGLREGAPLVAQYHRNLG